MAMIKLAIDAMSGDHGLATTIPAACLAAQRDPELHLILVGDQQQIADYLAAQHISLLPQINIHHASEIVQMDELPSQALRNKKDSSMRVALDLVKDGEATAIVSAGNTGALMATARFVLKMIDGIDRPAIIAALPTLSRKPVHMLDLGANVNCTPEQLLQFALMGSVFCEEFVNNGKPTVALLNIGAEEIKGDLLVKQTAELIQQHPQINYVGFIEANEIFQGEVDVVVCDGFVGNSVLKTAEGIVRMIFKILRAEFQRTFLNKLRGLIAKSVFSNVRSQIDPDIYNGSPLLGLNGIVIKSHGSANATAFFHAINNAKHAVQRNLPARIAAGLESLGHGN